MSVQKPAPFAGARPCTEDAVVSLSVRTHDFCCGRRVMIQKGSFSPPLPCGAELSAQIVAALDHRPTAHDAAGRVAATLMTLHVAAHAKGFAAARVRALVRLLARVRVAVDAQAAGATKGLVARRAEVLVLALRVDAALGRVQVVVMLPQLLVVDHLPRRKGVRQRLVPVMGDRLSRG